MQADRSPPPHESCLPARRRNAARARPAGPSELLRNRARKTLKTWHDITEIPAGIDPQLPVAVICGSGQRAATGASLVGRFGAKRVIHVVDGGVPKWGRLGHPLEHSEPASATA